MMSRLFNNFALAVAALTNGDLSLKREEGQGLVEYALIISTIAILVIGAMTFLRTQIEDVFTTIGNAL